MIIDIHTHSFPDALAPKALGRLNKQGGISNYTDGTNAGLISSMKAAGIDISVLLPVATKPEQTAIINENAKQMNAEFQRRFEEGECGPLLASFATVHPDNDDYKRILKDVKAAGIRGVKIHPFFTSTYIDDIRFLRIIEYCMETDLYVITHAGGDINPTSDYSKPKHIAPVLREIEPDKLILAHMGSWRSWDEAGELIELAPVYLDTAYSLSTANEGVLLEDSKFVQLVRKAHADHVMFGSDSPWTDQKSSLNAVQASGLTPEELELVTWRNAATILKLC